MVAAELDGQVRALAAALAGRPVAVLSGAGCSTESGIPDYRGEGTRRRARDPLRFRAFTGEAAARARYWARSAVGWPRFARARANPGHVALAELERAGVVSGIVTQNVDGLHQAAGSRRVVELHGSLCRARCMACGADEPRAALQARIEELNPGWSRIYAQLAPDGDADLPDAALSRFREPTCPACHGPLRPGVVFFGEAVPSARRAEADALVDGAGALLVVGSSLAVLSGLRLCRAAAARAIPVAIVNLGPTRGDALASYKVGVPSGVLLPALAELLAG